MRKAILMALALALGAGNFALAADPPKAEEDLKREAQVAASSNAVSVPGPQLAPSTLSEKEVQSRRMTNTPAARPVVPAPVNSQPQGSVERNTWWFIGIALAVLAAIVAFSRKPPKAPK